MKRMLMIIAMSTFTLMLVATANADQWVNVGPTSMPLSDLNTLQLMIEGNAPIGVMTQQAKPEMVDVGLASMPRSDFSTLTGLVSGHLKVETASYASKKKMVDLGILAMEQTEMDALSTMVRNGLLKHWRTIAPEDIASK